MSEIKHECFIGVKHNYSSTDLITLDDLMRNLRAYLSKPNITQYTLEDYCDRRKSTNVFNFDFCPVCGKKIDWKAIKRGVVQ